MTWLLSYIAMGIGVIVVLLLICYAFCGVIAFPFYLLWFIWKVIYFPIALINQVIYPIWVLPWLVLGGFTLYFFFKLFIASIKFFTSLKK